MANHLGLLVGTPNAATPPKPSDMAFARTRDEVIVRDICTLAAAPINDTIQLGTMGWETVLDPDGCKYHFTALGAGALLSIGDVTYPAALDNAVDVHAAGSANMMSVVTPPNYYQPLWQQLGYASLAAALAVGQQCTLFGTITGAAATGTVSWKIVGSRRI